MAKLEELKSKDHGHLKIAPNCAVLAAKDQHSISIRVTEVGQAICSFPVFFTKVTGSADWAMSAIMSLEVGTNLFIEDDKWAATYVPNMLQTYPLFLMNAPEGKEGYTVGINSDDKLAFNEADGEALFDDKGKASIAVSRMTNMLQEDVKNNIHTYKFTQKMEELELMKAMDVLVQYSDGRLNTLKGLYTIDEEKFQALSIEQNEELRKMGYVPAIYAMLLSMFQLNALIARNNLRDGSSPIDHVKIEVAKEAAAA